MKGIPRYRRIRKRTIDSQIRMWAHSANITFDTQAIIAILFKLLSLVDMKEQIRLSENTFLHIFFNSQLQEDLESFGLGIEKY